jgi:amino acid transporter
MLHRARRRGAGGAGGAHAVSRALPQRFARVHRRYQTPWFGTLVVGVSGCTIYLVMALVISRDGAGRPELVADMVESLALATALYYTVTAYAGV